MKPKHDVVVFEEAPENRDAYVPDLAGCVAASRTGADSERLIREAIEFLVGSLREDGVAVPEPATWTTLVEVA